MNKAASLILSLLCYRLFPSKAYSRISHSVAFSTSSCPHPSPHSLLFIFSSWSSYQPHNPTLRQHLCLRFSPVAKLSAYAAITRRRQVSTEDMRCTAPLNRSYRARHPSDKSIFSVSQLKGLKNNYSRLMFACLSV